MIATLLQHPRGKFQLYLDNDGFYRWNIISVNGKIIAASSEGFNSESYCKENAQLTLSAISDYFKQRPIIKPKTIVKPTQKLNLFQGILQR